ncbi:hypothetical protein [Nonomuraea indica]|uniref:Uncharacterized protein n=1 Tax=Nonomuraea indica TaxID=1581193 RepID=A0ABW8A6D4_9ACTN
MSGLDLGPKICLVLFLASGITLMALEPHGAELFGVALFSLRSVLLVWAFAFGRLALTVMNHHTQWPSGARQAGGAGAVPLAHLEPPGRPSARPRLRRRHRPARRPAAE